MTKADFWEEMRNVRAAMLAIGNARHVPMSPYPDAGESAIWFITAVGTDLVDSVTAGPADAHLIVTGAGDLHARIDGRASLSTHRAKLEELWNPVAASWFDGIDDPDIRLIRMDPTEAEVWATNGNLGFIVQLAKSKLTGEKPDMGEHFTVSF